MTPTRTAATILTAALLAGCVIVVPGGAGRWSSDRSILQGDGRVASASRPVAALPALAIEGRRRLDMQVDVQVGGAPGLTVEADSNLLEHVHTDVRGDTLHIWSDSDTSASRPVRIRYTVPRLDRLETSGYAGTQVAGLDGGSFKVVQRGSGRVELRGRVDRLEAVNSGSGSLLADALDAGDTRVTMNGSGRIHLGTVRGEALQATLYGSGGLTARGEVRSADITVHGFGAARLAGLRSQRAELATHGSGEIAIAVSGQVASRTDGSGTITVYGDPAERNVQGKKTTFVR
ncbi:GIN domain-containing protein [Pseudoduganella chitinolytica]|uniref:DUF2807 domain-containing protein n=1 Tax=Pseudoduganella chitinolytica TaxID=34070 RepID=A0ABY8BIQ0_9BURK|nr:DUF2807 domain-containing protein [Pseudoduganella chitinolytica]WEF34828.1 DUF2807 domain-containing protein [Pseudoduganella chitinolytica]